LISVHCGGYNEYGRMGLEHFIQTSGIILSEKGPSVYLIYGCAARNNGCFNIVVNSNEPDGKEFEDFIYYSPKIFHAIHGIQNMGQLNEFINIIPFIKIRRDCIEIDLDIFSFIGKCLSGDLESFWKKISRPERQTLGNVPFIDVYERMLFLFLLYAFEELQLPFVCKTFWPGKKFAVCLTHDVDEVKKTYQWVTWPLMYLRNRQLHLLKGQLYSLKGKLHGKEPFWTFDELVKIENSLNVKSSFYFLKEKGKVKIFAPGTWKLLGRRYDFSDRRVRQIMKQLYSGGWEIGLHGSYESYNDLTMLEKEKNDLQISLGNAVKGIRQHHLNLDFPKTWEYHEKIGMEYDTSLGFKDQMGFRAGTCNPFYLYSKNKRLNLLEIPLVIMDTPLLKDRGYRDGLSNKFEEMINTVSGFNGILTLLWHHAIFNEYEFPGWGKAYGKIIELCRDKNAWITGGGGISDWWHKRCQAGFEPDYEETCLNIKALTEDNCHFLNVYLPANRTIKKISNAKVIETDINRFTIRTNSLKNDRIVNIEFVE
jgi:hypothetical protein